MTAERWQEVKRVLEAALDRAPPEQPAFLDRACAGDPALRAEVASLLAAATPPPGAPTEPDFFERPAAGAFRIALGNASGDRFAVGAPPGADLAAALAAALDGRYALEHELGRGGMAVVYGARDLKHDRPVALKVLRPDVSAGLSAARFRREVRLAAVLQHPHIVPLLDSGEAAGHLWFTMPFVAGESLRARLAREGRLPVADAVRIAREAASALDYAHRHGVVHRDVKPENILLSDGQALVVDFGIAKALDAHAGASGNSAPEEPLTSTGTGVVLGTPAYMAPEQLIGAGAVDARADVYALGLVLYEMLAGRHPFAGRAGHEVIAAHCREAPPPLIQLAPTVPPALAALVMRCLEKDPARRPASGAAVLEALETGRTTPRPAWARRPALGALAGVGAAALLAVAGAAWWARDVTPVAADRVPARDAPVAALADAARPKGDASGLYLEGEQDLHRRTRASLLQAVDVFQRAVTLDPGLAVAHAGLATAYALLPSYAALAPDLAYGRAVAAARRALALDSTLAEPHATLGLVAMRRYRWDEAAAELRRAVARNPNLASAHQWYGKVLALQGRTADAVAAFDRALALDPLSAVIRYNHAQALFWARRHDAAAQLLEDALQFDTAFVQAHVTLGFVRVAQGRPDAGVAEFRWAAAREPDLDHQALLAYGLAAAGRPDSARRVLAAVRARAAGAHVSPADLALAAFAVGDQAEGFGALRRALDEHDSDLQAFVRAPMLDPVRRDPRFIAILRAMNL